MNRINTILGNSSTNVSLAEQAAKNMPLFLLTLILAFVLSGCDANSGNKTGKNDKDDKEVVAIPVKTTAAITGDISAYYPSTTTLEAEQEATVVSRVAGVVEKVFVEEGEMVNAGDPLLQIETDRLQLELKRSESNLKKMKNELDRASALYKKQLISSDSYEKLKYEYESLQTSHELAKLELQFATIKAPIDGVISKRHMKLGNMVRINEPIYQITDFDPLHAMVFVPEKELNKIRLKQEVRIQVDARTGDTFSGFVKRISPIVDANSGTFKVTIEVRDEEDKLKPGMFGRLVVVYDEHFDSVLVDKKAVLSEDNSFWVFVVREGKAFKQLITPGYVDETHMEIIAGLKAGDVVVIMGQNSLKNEGLIEIIDGPGKTDDPIDLEADKKPDDAGTSDDTNQGGE